MRWHRRPRSHRGMTRAESMHLDARQGPRAVRASGIVSSRWIARARRSEMRRPYAPNLAWLQRSYQTISHWSATARMDIPACAGIGPKGAASLLTRYGPIEDFPASVLGERRELALLFKRLATLRADKPLFAECR